MSHHVSNNREETARQEEVHCLTPTGSQLPERVARQEQCCCSNRTHLHARTTSTHRQHVLKVGTQLTQEALQGTAHRHKTAQAVNISGHTSLPAARKQAGATLLGTYLPAAAPRLRPNTSPGSCRHCTRQVFRKVLQVWHSRRQPACRAFLLLLFCHTPARPLPQPQTTPAPWIHACQTYPCRPCLRLEAPALLLPARSASGPLLSSAAVAPDLTQLLRRRLCLEYSCYDYPLAACPCCCVLILGLLLLLLQVQMMVSVCPLPACWAAALRGQRVLECLLICCLPPSAS
jgi:hypothetical protein